MPTVSNVDPTPLGRIRYWVSFVGKPLFWTVILLTLIALALELGAYRKEFKIAGPFAAETNPARHALVLEVPPEGRAAWWRQPLLGDDSGKASQSFLRLWIDGSEMGPPHTPHETIREGTNAGFSHWGPRVIFSLPRGEKNAPKTIVTLRYPVRPRGWVTFTLVFLSALLGGLLNAREARSLARSFRSLRGRLPAAVLRAPYLVLFGSCCVGVTASAVYLASSLYALATGWALPTTAILLWSPAAEWGAKHLPYLGFLLLTLAGSGTLATWIRRPNPTISNRLEDDEVKLRHLLRWCGIPVAACVFVLYLSATWSGIGESWAGIEAADDLHVVTIGGLLPFSDAHDHLAGAYDQAKNGDWTEFAQRRPLAAAFRSVLLLASNYSFPDMLLLQTLLVAVAACMAAYAVMVWRGVWAGLAFFSLTYIHAHAFLSSPLTEALSLFWALISIPFFVEAFRTGSPRPALVALAMMTVGQMMRMGSMLTIPALLVWLVWQFGNNVVAKIRIGLAATIVLSGVLTLNSGLIKLYGTNQGLIGSNFAYVACGLSMGTGWTGCPEALVEEGRPLPNNEAVAAQLLYDRAWENFRANPGILFSRLFENTEQFFSEYHDTIWRGYGVPIKGSDPALQLALVAISLVGIVVIGTREAKAIELSFWVLFWGSLVASASIVYADDGARILAASHPLVALFFAIGFADPVLRSPIATVSPTLMRFGVLGLIAGTILIACAPWISHRLSSTGELASSNLLSKPGEALLLGGRRMTGFLVVADSEPLPAKIPSFHIRGFEAIIGRAGGKMPAKVPPLPFGFVYAPRLEQDALSWYNYIVPAEVLERRDVGAWRFQFEEDGNQNGLGSHWFLVTKAEPFSK